MRNKERKREKKKTKQTKNKIKNKIYNYRLREAFKVMNVIHHGNYKRRKEQQLDSSRKIIIGYLKSGHGVCEHRPMVLTMTIYTHGSLIYA